MNSFETQLNFELIGTLIALAIYNSVLLEIHLPRVLYRKLMDEPVSMEDLQEFEPQLYTTLQNILKSQAVEAMELHFSVDYDNYGMVMTKELKEGGASLLVTEANKQEFVALYTDWVLNESIKAQFASFYKGFYKVVSRDSIKVRAANQALQQRRDHQAHPRHRDSRF